MGCRTPGMVHLRKLITSLRYVIQAWHNGNMDEAGRPGRCTWSMSRSWRYKFMRWQKGTFPGIARIRAPCQSWNI
jgi:hypothetical protein